MKLNLVAASVGAALAALGSGNAYADDWSFSGFVRQEFAYKTTNDYNINNIQGNSFNGVAVPNSSPLTNGALGDIGFGVTPTLTRPASQTKHNDWNQFSTRLELNADGHLSEAWSAHVKLRGIADELGSVDKAFKHQNTFIQNYTASGAATPLEANGKDWMLDLPAAYVDYSNGPLWLRFGNQQIAWGEALFFRVSDVLDGLDLRRHSVLGVSAEEYSDARVPSLGARGSYRITDDWEIEGFTQRFQPSVLPGQGSAYNPIPAQFTVDDRSGYDDAKNKLDLGMRLRGKFGDYGVQAFAVRRNNPDGVYKWTTASGPGAIPGTAFQAGTGTGVYSAQEWMNYAAATRLDGVGGLLTSLNEFPIGGSAAASTIAGACGASSAAPNAIALDGAAANCVLDTFFAAYGNLQGHIRRDFPRETVLGFGVNHVFEGEPDSLLDQLIGRFELSYTPNKKFTNPTLSQQYIEKNETQFAFIAEKYHKFSSEVPATYIVAQWLHKTASDLFGRALEGLDNTPGSHPKGQSGFNAVAFAVQQPSPTLEWRYDFTVLTDLKGGWLLQPGVKWKPNKAMQLDVYANILKSTGSDNSYRNFAQGLEYANEVFVRGTYAF